MSGLPSGGRLQYRHKACLLFKVSSGSNRHVKKKSDTAGVWVIGRISLTGLATNSGLVC